MTIKTQYTVKSGDRITRIAANYKVTPEEIINANPSIFTVTRLDRSAAYVEIGELNNGEVLIYAGEVLAIPSSGLDDIQEEQTIKADSEDELNIIIEGTKCPLPHEFTFSEYFESCSDSFSMTYPYDATEKTPAYSIDIEDYVNKGLPGIKLFIGSEIVLTGSIETVTNNVTPRQCSQSLEGRSATFLLEKSDIFPRIEREFINQKWGEIAEAVLKAYSLKYEVSDEVDISEPFSKINIEDNEKPFVFLSRLAKERQAILGKTGNGKLLIHKAVDSEPVAAFKIEVMGGQLTLSTGGQTYDFIGVQSLTMSFDTRELYGQYQGKTTTTDDQDLQSTVKSSVLLQQSIKITDISEATEQSIDSIMSWEEQKSIREFYKNSIPFPGWINPNNGKRWKVGEIITLQAPEAGIPNAKRMLIRQIDFEKTAGDKRTATLFIVPAETYL